MLLTDRGRAVIGPVTDQGYFAGPNFTDQGLTIIIPPIPPIVTIVSISRDTISRVSGRDQCAVVFKFDAPVKAYTVRVMGASPSTGANAGGYPLSVESMSHMTVSELAASNVEDISSDVIEADTELTETIDIEEVGLEANDGVYRINIYGQGLSGVWTLYEG